MDRLSLTTIPIDYAGDRLSLTTIPIDYAGDRLLTTIPVDYARDRLSIEPLKSMGHELIMFEPIMTEFNKRMIYIISKTKKVEKEYIEKIIDIYIKSIYDVKNVTFESIINMDWIELYNEININLKKSVHERYIEKKRTNKNIFPSHRHIFSFTNYCKPSDIKIVILGQDPYYNVFYNKNEKLHNPVATGLAFSIKKECKITPSLHSIYKNLQKYSHVDNVPSHGDLSGWAYQGILLLNTALTVEKDKPASHADLWEEFINDFLRKISRKYLNLIFVLWGGHALNKKKYISYADKHHFIISSHPSPLSVNKKLKTYESFENTDHFGKINDILKSEGKQIIDWNIYD